MLTQFEGPLLLQEVNDTVGVAGSDYRNMRRNRIHRTRRQRGEPRLCGLP